MTAAEKLQIIAENELKVHEAGYKKGYAKCNADMQPEIQTSYNEGYAAGKADALSAMIPIEIQSQYRYATPNVSDGSRVFPESVFETSVNSFYDFADYGWTVSSQTVTITGENYSSCYAHFYFQVLEDMGVETYTKEIVIVCPPNTDRSADYSFYYQQLQDESYTITLKGVRFSIYEEYVPLW